MTKNMEKLDRGSSTFSSFSWPVEFGNSESGVEFDEEKINRVENEKDQIKQKYNSLCKRSFLTADTEEERNFLFRVCDENGEDENKGNDILYKEASSTGGSNAIKWLPRLASGSGYGQHDALSGSDYDDFPYRNYLTSDHYGVATGEYGDYGHYNQQPITIIRIVRPERSQGLFDTFLNFFRIGFEPFILLLGLAGAVGVGTLFFLIQNRGKRSMSWSGAALIQTLADQELENLERRVVKGGSLMLHLTKYNLQG